MGRKLESRVGCADGWIDIAAVGNVGILEDPGEGGTLDLQTGAGLGANVGKVVGASVGLLVGELLEARVGSLTGCVEGSSVGIDEGARVDSLTGSGDDPCVELEEGEGVGAVGVGLGTTVLEVELAVLGAAAGGADELPLGGEAGESVDCDLGKLVGR